MKIHLHYFTGTGNSLRVIDTCKSCFEKENHEVTLSEIDLKSSVVEEADLIGFCFPVYAFDIPRICRKFLKSIPKFKPKQQVFILVTAGDEDESGFSIINCSKILLHKNCDIVYADVIEMPANWTTAMNPPDKHASAQIVKKGTEKAEQISNDILKGIQNYHEFNVPKRLGKIGLYKEYCLFKYLGIYNLWRSFKVYDSCNGCQLCARTCPTKSIDIVNKTPQWKSSCEQCMRCVNICPSEAIYQSYGGGTKGKNRYIEPHFKPKVRKSD